MADTNKLLTDTNKLLTVTEAAARLGIQERRLRHILSRPEHAARTRHQPATCPP